MSLHFGCASNVNIVEISHNSISSIFFAVNYYYYITDHGQVQNYYFYDSIESHSNSYQLTSEYYFNYRSIMNGAEVTWEGVLEKVIEYAKMEAERHEDVNVYVQRMLDEYDSIDALLAHLRSTEFPPEGTKLI